MHDLEELLGADIKQIISPSGDILEENLSALVNRECEIEVAHVHNPMHTTPFCKVQQIRRIQPLERQIT